MRYAELDNVLYRASDGGLYSEKLVRGRWLPNGDAARVSAFGTPIDAGEASRFAGAEWPGVGVAGEASS